MNELFTSAHAALTFAYNYSGHQYAPSAIAKMMGPNIGSGKGLVGLDGAGQAGMILREVIGLSTAGSPTYVAETARHFVAARFAPHAKPCPACGAHTMLVEDWASATDWIAARGAAELPGCVPNFHLRIGLVRRFFGEPINMSDIAAKAHCHRNVASEQNGKLKGWLMREERRALDGIARALQGAGLVESSAADDMVKA